ncbi:carbohydrate ABC transporter permease [Paenibacillus sp.]|uniref:carbohydrate ABC transporter permease n=1 Tax=Paenibacillus sp. TaxID=58172 RepID=UPI002D50A641|nr:carbohydrate ABC transporter permease [Paenibacillus sp.]HZG56686.1 carbohydrate ABC transporter permease [Paenibacillus sp.]
MARTIINALFVLISLSMFLPFVLVITSSFSAEQSIIENGYQYIPSMWSLEGYQTVFKSPAILMRAYGVTAFITVVGTLCSLLLTSMTAYVLSRRDYSFNRPAAFYVFFTMLFSGGLVPFYILMTQYLHLKDNILSIILPGLLNVFYVMIMRSYMLKIPFEMIESAKMDGAGEFRIFFRMVLPLSTPGLATLGLMISFGYWNEWFNALLFLENQKLAPLQLLLQRMIRNIEFLTSNSDFVSQFGIEVSLADLPKYNVRMAMAILAAGPMMFVFPFFQRYFVAGLTIGSLKG